MPQCRLTLQDGNSGAWSLGDCFSSSIFSCSPATPALGPPPRDLRLEPSFRLVCQPEERINGGPPTYPVVVPQEGTQASDILVTMTAAIACLQLLAAAAGELDRSAPSSLTPDLSSLSPCSLLPLLPTCLSLTPLFFGPAGPLLAASGGEVEARLRWLAPDGEEVTLGGSPFSAEASVGLRVILSEPAQEKPRSLSLILSPPVGEEGSVAELQCKVSGIPRPNITWEHQGLVSSAPLGRATVHGETLIIREPEPSDAGVYPCEASIAERTESAGENMMLSDL
ncbi:hemicentin-2-like [Sarcophilus harrisii]|uniref:hemicentin-2-like n=1 Tax=Sarcophilus harrisii TaxID=9305 RepID=UPI001301CAF4|nr:hemicentin-2-like [Sarcophilus harrisii]